MTEQTDRQLRLERDPTTLWRGVIGGVLLLPPGADEAWHVTTPGDVIWDVLAEPHTIDELAEVLAEKYREPPSSVYSDIEPIVRTMHEIGAIRSVRGPTSPEPESTP